MGRPGRRRRRDRGVALIIMGLTMTALLLVAAFAVDFGAARTARRKGQGTVDGATLAGGQLLLSETGTLTGADAASIADEVIEVTYLNLTADAALSDAGDLTAAEWRARFASCTDPDRDASRFAVTSAASPCISFNTQMTRVRVRLPDLNVGTYFAPVIGFDNLTVHAVAEAELVPTSSGGVLPFGMPGGANGPEACLKSDTLEIPPCDGPDNGNFGPINVRFFGNPVLGTPEVCSGEETVRLTVNIALGIDHRLSEYVSGTPVNDDDACPDLSLQPNRVDGRPGFTAQTVDDGLIAGTELDGHPIPGRLTGGPWATRDVRSGAALLDDQPLWAFLDPALASGEAPDECLPSVTVISSKAQMATCLTAYIGGAYTAPLFDASILQSPRLAWVPRFHETEWGNGRSDYKIAEFTPVFLQTLYFNCTGSSCGGVFDPGESGSGLPLANSNDNKVEAVTSLMLTDSMLPPAVLEQGPTGSIAHALVLRR